MSTSSRSTGATPAHPSTAWLGQAPHRLLFFIGAGNLLLAMGWWTAWLASARWGLLPLPQATVYPGWLHAFVMQYQVLPSFIFGFLLTVFPRWMGLRELTRRQYLPVGAGLFIGQALLLAAALGVPGTLWLGLVTTLAGWSIGTWRLTGMVRAERGRTWHARSCVAALWLGGAGLVCFGVFLAGGAPWWLSASVRLGTFGMLLPIYLTVAHRMVPFFAGNVVAGYVAWRPMAWLAALWSLLVLRLALDLGQATAWSWLADVPLLMLALVTLWRWWPRAAAPGLLWVLFAGLVWWPVTHLLYALQSLVQLYSGQWLIARAPAHALFIGLFGSLLVAMVTRVTQGHSGRPLRMTVTGWCAFFGIQAVAALRIAAEAMPDTLAWLALSALGWLVVLGPWVARIGMIYLSPRADGKPG